MNNDDDDDLQVLYAVTNPGYIYFLYIVAPVNLVVLNPIAFVLMEYSRKKVRQ